MHGNMASGSEILVALLLGITLSKELLNYLLKWEYSYTEMVREAV